MEEMRQRVIGLAAEAAMSEDPSGWFEQIYTEAEGDWSQVPWADQRANPLFSSWLDRHFPTPPHDGAKALVIGCGLGDDAVYLERAGWKVNAFDISQTAIDWAEKIHPDSMVDWRVGNLLEPPVEWFSSFDLVVEIHILQAMAQAPRQDAAEVLTKLLNEQGLLVCIGRLSNPEVEVIGPPWPLTKDWILAIGQGCELQEFSESRRQDDEPDTLRFRAVWKR
jgi:2-polyprenyl-3-methyl-5-hydroxy-6-metoxy-1,4-benzoquinol methylase